MAPKSCSEAVLLLSALVQRHRSPYAHRTLLVAAIALALLSCASATGSSAASNGLRRILQGIPRKTTRGQCTAECPDSSSCGIMRGAPVCKCPYGQRFQPDGTCSTAALDHSDWLDPMNNARAAVGSSPLKWDDSLAAEAQAVAEKIGRTGCKLNHIDTHGHGQVLAGGPQRQWPPIDNSEAVNRGWVSEGALYSYAKFNSKTASGCITGNWHHCGHYIQVVWAASKRVGCGVAQCKCCGGRGKIYVCHFDPAGNVEKTYPYALDPCYGVSCPDNATCDASQGYPVCKCPPGEANVNGTCVSDPCDGVSCSGNFVCDGTSGEAQCACPQGQVLALEGSDTCIDPSCLNVVCPSQSTCAVGPANTPFCDCGAGNVLLGGVCTPAPKAPVPVTSIAIWNAPSYTTAPAQSDDTSNTTGPMILRFQQVGQCQRLNPKLAGSVGSYRIVWNVWNAMNTSVLPDAQAAPCRRVTFWPNWSCKGKAMAWNNPFIDNGITLSSRARGAFATAKAIQCT